MKKFFKCVFYSCIVLTVGFGSFKAYELYKEKKEQKIQARRLALAEEKPFVIIIPSYNNSKFCEKNLASVLNQNYANFRVIYIDDCSTDDTYQRVKEIIGRSKQREKVSLIRNERNKGALQNIYETVHQCQDYEIIVLVDGDDFLAHENVLTKLNRIYSISCAWMTYGNFLDYPSYNQKPVKCKPFPKTVIFNNSFRTHEWVSSHLRTFYAGLFKMIKKEDFFYKNNQFFPMGWDNAILFPLLEMSGKRSYFIKDILYLYNRTNPLSDHKVNFDLQNECVSIIRKMPKYKRLKALPFDIEKGSKEKTPLQ